MNNWRFVWAMLPLLILAVIGASTAAFSSEHANGYGLGIDSCAVFAKKYTANPEVAESVYFTWAQGFMSGLNFVATANGSVYRVITGSDMTTQKADIRSYCEAHPLTQYVGAVIDLYQSFPTSQQKP